MPRKKRTIVEETLPDVASEAEDLSDVICVLTKVYKMNAGGKSFCFQTTEPVDEVSIQLQYPSGGKFVVLEYNTLNQVIGTTHIDIEPKPMPVSANGNGDDIRTRLMLEELSFTRSMMLKLIEGLTTGRTQHEGTPLGELAQAMQVVNDLSSKSNPVDLIMKGMELGIKANGGAPDWKAQLVESIPTVVQTIGAATAAKQQIQQGQPTMIATTPASIMKQGIDWLKPQILAGMSTDLAIGWVMQNAKDPLCGQLINTAIRGDVNTFIEVDPELANEPYRTWFESAIQLLKDEYAAATEQSNDTDDNERGNGDRSDVTNNEKVNSGKSKISKVS